MTTISSGPKNTPPVRPLDGPDTAAKTEGAAGAPRMENMIGAMGGRTVHVLSTDGHQAENSMSLKDVSALIATFHHLAKGNPSQPDRAAFPALSDRSVNLEGASDVINRGRAITLGRAASATAEGPLFCQALERRSLSADLLSEKQKAVIDTAVSQLRLDGIGVPDATAMLADTLDASLGLALASKMPSQGSLVVIAEAVAAGAVARAITALGLDGDPQEAANQLSSVAQCLRQTIRPQDGSASGLMSTVLSLENCAKNIGTQDKSASLVMLQHLLNDKIGIR